MARSQGVLLSAVLAVLLAVPAAAQIGGHPFEVSGTAGLFSPDIRGHMQTSPAYNGALGWRFGPAISVDLAGTWAPAKADTAPNQNDNFFLGSLDLRLGLRPFFKPLVPYLLLGAGYASSHTTGHVPDFLDRGAATVGAGLLVNIVNQRTYLRFQVRDVAFRDRDFFDFSDHLAVTAGVHFVLRSKPMDQDHDSVRDDLDQCPNTPLGATVDVHGCPHDADGDGVLDGLDQCNDTPKGCKIDAKGCSIDSDGDGVCDGIDECPDTPKGATVDAKGCPHDTDGDGVLDGLDKCNDTPKGCTIDANGCQSDADKDGVCDGLDQCPNTPQGLQVDAHGCPIEVSEKEIELLDTGSIRIQNIEFDTGKATIKPESYAVIDTVAKILQQYPTLAIEIGGHTDNTGTPEVNLPLSQARADSVLSYLREHYPNLNAEQYRARGYGAGVPIAPNSSVLGRARNRRVEFKVLNVDALRIERERRRFLEKGETAPSDSTKSVPSDSTKSAPSDSTKSAPPESVKSPPAPEVPTSAAPADTTKH